MKYTITALVPVKNEAHNLPRCLAALIPWCDQVLVIDMESSDQTANVALAGKARVIHWKASSQQPFIELQKAINQTAREAHTQWVFRVDADEVVTPQLQKEIVTILEQGSEAPYKAYGVPRAQYFWGGFLKGGDWAYDRLVRLYQPGIARYKEAAAVHEQLELEVSIGLLTHHLEHYSHPTLEAAIEKFNRYTTIEANQLNVRLWRAYWNMLMLPPYIFFRWMLWHHGWRDGVRGIVAASMRAWYEFILWAKYLERI